MRKSSQTVLVILILLSVGFYFGRFIFTLKYGKVSAAIKPQTGKVIEASQNYLEPGKNKCMMMIDLGSTTCIPCKMMAPVMAELAKELQGKLDVEFVDITIRGDLAQKYKIYAIPTQIFFDRNGKELFRHLGFYSKAEIIAKLKELGLK